MWLILAFLSATLLGFYDSFKKQSLRDNAVIPVLFLNTLFSSLIFLPFILLSSSTTVLDGVDIPCGIRRVEGPQIYSRQELYRIVLLDIRIFRYEASASHYRRTNQCHPSCNGIGGSLARLWRTAQRLSVDWCGAGCRILFHAQQKRQEGGHRLQTRQVDIFHHPCRCARCCQRTLRQIPHGAAR